MTQKNKWGFPLVTCGRCHGSGHHKYNTLHGTVCYGCGGSGWAIEKRAKKAYGEFRQYLDSLTRPTTLQLEAGDLVKHRDGEMRVIAKVEKTDRSAGHFTSGDVRIEHFFYLVTFESGETEEYHQQVQWKRVAKVTQEKVDEFLALIPKPRKK